MSIPKSIILAGVPTTLSPLDIADMLKERGILEAKRITQIPYPNGSSYAFIAVNHWLEFGNNVIVPKFFMGYCTPYIIFGKTRVYIYTAPESNNDMVVSNHTEDFSDEFYKRDSSLSYPDETYPVKTGPDETYPVKTGPDETYPVMVNSRGKFLSREEIEFIIRRVNCSGWEKENCAGWERDIVEIVSHIKQYKWAFDSIQEEIDEVTWKSFIKKVARLNPNEKKLVEGIEYYTRKWKNSETELVMRGLQKIIVFLINTLFTKSGGSLTLMNRLIQEDLDDDETDIHDEHEFRVASRWYNLYKEQKSNV